MLSPIFLLTDFGDRDAYVGVMKAVCLRIEAKLQVIDLCHGIEPQNVVSAGYVLLTAIPYLPYGSVVACVIDPGVGTERRIIACELEHCTILAPDNGLCTMVLERYPCTRVTELEWERFAPDVPSTTFHGRDIFAPAAALIASKQRSIESLGTRVPLKSVFCLSLYPHQRSDSSLEATVLHCDHFGNLVTNVEAFRWNITSDLLRWCCRVEDVTVPLVRTYADVQPGEVLCYLGSSGFLELAVRNGSARHRFGASPTIIFFPRHSAL